MNIWILQTGEPLHCDNDNSRPMRAMNLANALVNAGHHVTLWSSAFYHQKKQHRTRKFKKTIVNDKLEILLLPSPGYKKNTGLERLWDHLILAISLKKQLKIQTSLPDVAFVGYPPIEVAAIMTRWLTLRGVPTLLDVKDQWPNIFVEALPKILRPIGYVAFSPYFYLAKRAMRDATGISAMADSFLKKMLLFAKIEKSLTSDVFPLASSNNSVSANDLDKANEWLDKLGIKKSNRLRICYIGNISPNVDFKPIKLAASYFLKKQVAVDFIICGEGVSLEDYKTMVSGLNNIYFLGRVDQAKASTIYLRSQATLIPYVNTENFQLSLPNKSIDSLSFGLPILSPLQGEVANLIETYNVGLRYGSNSGKSLIECIERIIADPDLQRKMSTNAFNLYKRKFSYTIVYTSLVKHLEYLSKRI